MKKALITIIAIVLGIVAYAQPKIVAHRGYWKAANGAQNSIEAFNKADSIGAYASEFDVWMTRDGRLAVNHDPVVQGVDMRTSPSDSIFAIRLTNGETIPTLDAFLKNAQQHPAIRLVLEIKPLPDLVREDQEAAKILKLLKKYGLTDRTDIISFSINACLAVKKLYPQIPVYYLDGDLAPRKIKQLGLDGLDYHGSVFDKNPTWVDDAHKLGLKVNVWTIDKPEAKQKYTDMGVDFITTNNPE